MIKPLEEAEKKFKQEDDEIQAKEKQEQVQESIDSVNTMIKENNAKLPEGIAKTPEIVFDFKWGKSAIKTIEEKISGLKTAAETNFNILFMALDNIKTKSQMYSKEYNLQTPIDGIKLLNGNLTRSVDEVDAILKAEAEKIAKIEKNAGESKVTTAPPSNTVVREDSVKPNVITTDTGSKKTKVNIAVDVTVSEFQALVSYLEENKIEWENL